MRYLQKQDVYSPRKQNTTLQKR